MDARQVRSFASVDTALAVISRPEFNTPAIVQLRDQLAAVRDSISRAGIDQYVTRQRVGIHAKTIAELRRLLRVEHLLPVSRRGRLLLEGLPGIDDELRVPHARDSDATLLAAATRIASAVRPHAKAFRQAKFPTDFIKQLERAAAALETALASPDETRLARPRTTVLVRREIAHARQIIATIDSLVVAEFHRRPALVAEWRRAKRIGGRIGRPPAPKKSNRRRSRSAAAAAD